MSEQLRIWQQEPDGRELFYRGSCDKYDYLLAAGCGAIAGLVDIFMVGTPQESALQTWTDAQVDKAVMAFARKCGWNPRKGNEKNIASAIGFLERKFPVNYDQPHSAAVGGAFNMASKNHHMKSLGHAPDVIGLFFSILNQFTSTSSFLHDGKLITIQSDSNELQGHDFVSKLFCGVANWFGHIMSDIAGSSGASKRGSGVVIPFFELFQLCDFGAFQVGENRNTLAVLATKTFQEGYDARFGLTMSIPVVLCDLTIRLIWAIKQHFYHKRPLEECVPTKWHDDLRVMLIVGDGVLCVIDGADAAAFSGGNWLNFFLRMDLIAWFRFLTLVLREVCIRLGLTYPQQERLDAYIRINGVLRDYLSELEKIDHQKFREETKQYEVLIANLQQINTEEQLTQLLKQEYELLGIPLPYEGDFNTFMQDDHAHLVFQ